MHYSFIFEPLLPAFWLICVLIPPAILVFTGLIMLRRGYLLRVLTLAVLALALINPVFLQEYREPLKSTLAVIIDRSQSQKFGQRAQDTDEAVAILEKALQAYPQFEPRFIEAGKPDSSEEGTSTRLFSSLGRGLADVPPSRIAGAIMISDGQVHDIPVNAKKSEFKAPVNVLVTGNPAEYDRRIRFIEAPRFGIVNKPLRLSMIVEDQGSMPTDMLQARVDVLVNGEAAGSYKVTAGEETPFEITLPHAGTNIIELKTGGPDGELTQINNHAAIMIDGIRENLKVLLISGEPHNGLRTWRDLLKSDTGVDLIHFTILRPPEKQDNTPLNQLSLIVFPTTELFVEKINDFDLVIFDRYQHYDVLPMIYYDYMARYVENGGALLMATGPEFAGGTSLAVTPLIRVLPAGPTGNIIDRPFLPHLTPEGMKHPVTHGLEGSNTTPPKWGRWLRQIEAIPTQNTTVLMKGADDWPLMLLAHVGKGRVGMLLSDEGWLWARGFEGGGPYASLYRRMAHWLMGEPELEEEALFATSNGNQLVIHRQTMKDSIGSIHIQLPSGKTSEIQATKTEDGIFTATFESDEIGLIRITNDDKTTVAHVGPINAPEYGDIISTTEKLKPLAMETGGNVMRLHKQAGDAVTIGTVQPVRKTETSSGAGNRIILKESSDTRLDRIERIPLFSGLTALAAGLFFLCAVWYREAK